MNDQSAQPCGCDPGAGYTCRNHQEAAKEYWDRHIKQIGQKDTRERNTALYADGCGAPTAAAPGETSRYQGSISPFSEKMHAAIKADYLGAPNRVTTLPQDPKERKKYPIATGVLFYFPDAIAAVARVSFEGNEQHNPGEPLHWARGKSMDQEDTLVRHLMESGTFDTDGQRHSAKAAWRALAMLQLEIERDRQ